MSIFNYKEESQKINNLGKAVIVRAIKDLYSDNYWKKKDAKFFLFNDSEHLSTICDLANIDKSKLLKIKNKYSKKAIPQELLNYSKFRKKVKND